MDTGLMCQPIQSRPQRYSSLELGAAQGQPRLRAGRAALAEKVSTFSESGKVFRAIKV